MLYYSISTLAENYSLSAEAIKHKIRRKELLAVKIPKSNDNPNFFKFVVPASELPKIEKFKLHDPVCHIDDQPEYWRALLIKQRENKNAWIAREKKVKAQYERREFYREYLRSETWENKRQQRLKMDGLQCQICGTGKNLHVHHITYEHFGAEPMQDLITVCDNCHRKIHENDITSATLDERIDEARGIDFEAEYEEIQSLEDKAHQFYDELDSMRKAAQEDRRKSSNDFIV